MPQRGVAGVVASWTDMVDPRVRQALAAQGIEELYPPQQEVLPPITKGDNVVVAIPTAAGKSLIAYLAILNKHLTPTGRGKALYIVPLRALAWEKFEELREFRPLGLSVGLATGDPDDEDRRLSRYDVVVTTSEKADSLLRHRAQWLNQVDLIVADEVHLINDGYRGPTLEVLLARFRAQRDDLQVVALSATIANAAELAAWLKATLVASDWRPTPLKRGILFGKRIEFEDATDRLLGVDVKDPVTALVLDIQQEGAQALVFVNTRRSTEAVARRLAPKVGRVLAADAKRKAEELAEELTRGRESSGTGERLAEVVRGGVAFHNAGLDARQRRLVERAFRAGTLRALVATPTLAAGVNTPARRVIVRDVWRYQADLGNQPIPVLEIMQMMGRAGRPRYDPYGEAVLIAKTEEQREQLRDSYILADPEPIMSKLGAEPALRMHVLATIAAGFARNEPGVFAFLDSTFYAHQGEGWLIKERTRQVLGFLEDNGFIQRDGEGLRPTLFGKRTSDLYIDPLSALTLKRAIETARTRTDVPTFAWLHALASTVDVRALFLGAKDEWVWEKAAEEEEGLLLSPADALSHEDFLSHVKTAALLEDWVQETGMDTIEERFRVGPGDVRDKVDRGRWLAHAMRELARVLHFESATALNDLPMRLESGVREELLPLVRLDGVGRIRARRLFAAGFTGIAKLRKAKVEQLQRVETIGPKLAKRILEQVTAGKATDEADGRPEQSLEAY